jgi:hypothetical protein
VEQLSSRQATARSRLQYLDLQYESTSQRLEGNKHFALPELFRYFCCGDLGADCHAISPEGRVGAEGVTRLLMSVNSGPSMPKTRIMYIEDKSSSLNGPARIGRVTFSKTGKSISYRGRTFQSSKGSGFKTNYRDVDSGERFWISGPRGDGKDRLYPESSAPIEIDPDVAEEYWRDIRGKRSP